MVHEAGRQMADHRPRVQWRSPGTMFYHCSSWQCTDLTSRTGWLTSHTSRCTLRVRRHALKRPATQFLRYRRPLVFSSKSAATERLPPALPPLVGPTPPPEEVAHG